MGVGGVRVVGMVDVNAIDADGPARESSGDRKQRIPRSVSLRYRPKQLAGKGVIARREGLLAGIGRSMSSSYVSFCCCCGDAGSLRDCPNFALEWDVSIGDFEGGRGHGGGVCVNVYWMCEYEESTWL